MADAADGEDEFEAVDQRLSESQKFSLYKDLEGYRSLWDTSYVPSKTKNIKTSCKRKKAKRNYHKSTTICTHIHFPISFLRPFLVLAVQKAQTESGKHSLPTEKEQSSRHLCLHTTDESYAQYSANLQQYVLLRNKLATQVVIRAAESFNLHCNNVARQVEEECCPYYWTFTETIFFCGTVLSL